MKKVKAIWRYFIFIPFFPVWWVIFLLLATFLSIVGLILNCRWEFGEMAEMIGITLNPINMFFKLEKDLRTEVREAWLNSK